MTRRHHSVLRLAAALLVSMMIASTGQAFDVAVARGGSEGNSGQGHGSDIAAGQELKGFMVTNLVDPLTIGAETVGSKLEVVITLQDNNKSGELPLNFYTELVCLAPDGVMRATGNCAVPAPDTPDICVQEGVEWFVASQTKIAAVEECLLAATEGDLDPAYSSSSVRGLMFGEERPTAGILEGFGFDPLTQSLRIKQSIPQGEPIKVCTDAETCPHGVDDRTTHNQEDRQAPTDAFTFWNIEFTVK
jgi:hypothetical protein